MSTYEKQLRWKKAVLSLSQAAQKREEDDANESLSFTPQYYSVPLVDFEGTARQSTDKSSQSHIERQSKARKQKNEQANRLRGSERSGMSASNGRESTSSYNFDDEESRIIHENSLLNDFARSGLRARSHANEDSENRNTGYSGEGDDIPVVELLENERKEWQLERLKLIHCIHLQQIELSQRSAAAYDRATDIAKEFARAIEGFEERLITVETNVQREIMAIKVIAESIKAAVSNDHQIRKS